MNQYALLILKSYLITNRFLQNNIICCIEEMSEVTKVLTKYLRGREEFNRKDLEEEISHALMMLDIVRARFHISTDTVERYQVEALRKAIKEDSK